MALNGDLICGGIIKAISEIRHFIGKERTQAENLAKLEYWERDMSILDKMEADILDCKEDTLKNLVDDIRGLSHYFGPYVSNTEKLDAILDNLYHKVQNAIISLRET